MDIPLSGNVTGAPQIPSVPHDILVKQKQGQSILIWAVGAFCIYGWEWILCAPKEYRVVWRKPMNLSSIIYIANRYFGLFQFSFVVSLATDVWSRSACKQVYLLEPIGALISTILSQLILGNRVYAVYGRNKVVGYALWTILLGEIVTGGVSISTISSPAVTGPPGTQTPCGALTGPFGWLTTYFTMPLLYDLFTFLLIAWKAYDLWRRDLKTPLFTIIWHDGLLYFLANLAMNIVNVLIFVIAPETLRDFNLAPTIMFQVILSCRMFLNLKGTNERPDAYTDRMNVPDKLRFRHTSGTVSGTISKDNTNSTTSPVTFDSKRSPVSPAQEYELDSPITPSSSKPFNDRWNNNMV